MEYRRLGGTAEKIETLEVRSIPQSQLTSECWDVQFRGFRACERCEYKGKKNCGGKNIRKTGKNSLGFSVPLGRDLNVH